MKLIFVRHGDPDYEHDTLTETGRIEAKLAAERLKAYDFAACYVSPLGRAQDTARYTLEACGMTAETMPWLREFHAPILHPDTGDVRVPWDWLPAVWTTDPCYYDKDHWADSDVMQEYRVGEEAKRVQQGLAALLERHGYVRDGMFYRVTRANTDTLLFFCHFGVEALMLAHLTGASPMVYWHGFCAAPTAMTVVTTEERRAGIASFRINTFGDTGHLLAGGREPSFSGRFCETWAQAEQRHD
ncbi:MAG: histidine phosphatase family protein [Oscillospiraceae bacterium]|nr:histidine phosphatase family protein [Oscillospiraceae bacterium]